MLPAPSEAHVSQNQPNLAAAPRSSKAPRASAGSKPRPFQVRPDFVFPRLKLAVFVDGCFWHGCPLHATQPKQNAEFWRLKIAANQARDRLVTRTRRLDYPVSANNRPL